MTALGVRLEMCNAGLHQLTPENTYTDPTRGVRYCRVCKRTREHARYQSARAEQLANDPLASVRYRRAPIQPCHGRVLTEAQVLALRAQITCVVCGMPPVERPDGRVRTDHKAGCQVQHNREGGA